MSTQPTTLGTGQAGSGLAIHSAGPLEKDALAGILRGAANARAALVQGAGFEVVVQGPAVTLLAANSPTAEASVGELQVGILACGNSMRSAGMDNKDLAPGVGAVPAAIANLTQRQWSGWAYVRL